MVIYNILIDDKATLKELILENLRISLGIPLASMLSFLIVLILEIKSGNVEFKIPGGFEFKGAAGPVIFWLLCFMAIISSIRLLQ